MTTPPKRIDLKQEEMESLKKRISSRTLEDNDYEIIGGMAETIQFLSYVVEEKKFSIGRLLRLIFGKKTEKAKTILPPRKNDKAENKKEDKGPDYEPPPSGNTANNDDEDKVSGDEPPSSGNAANKDDDEESHKGHGKNGASDYTGAAKIIVSHPTLRPGSPCPLCPGGKTYEFCPPGVVVRVVGSSPIQADVYELQKFRCNLCGEVFTASLPEKAGPEKYDQTVGTMIALLKYGTGMPFNRLENLQANFGIPLPASTQWDIVEKLADKIYPVHNELIRQAAQGEVIHNDDTTMKILSLMKENELNDPSRTGMFTTGILSLMEGRKIALFFTGRNHAGENMGDLLQFREKDLPPPIQMCDALSRNKPEDFEVILANCLTHARRNFTDVIANFPEKCRYVIEIIGETYKNDKESKQKNMSPQERLIFHQENSGPIMEKLKSWLHQQLDDKEVEPNSSMGKAISYMIKHWPELTLFLRVENAPLDNNLCEQILKRSILHRKNALFYKTEHGAYIGDIFMSIIHTCNLNKVNPFAYLKTIYKHSSDLFKNPSKWLPWNYQDA